MDQTSSSARPAVIGVPQDMASHSRTGSRTVPDGARAGEQQGVGEAMANQLPSTSEAVGRNRLTVCQSAAPT